MMGLNGVASLRQQVHAGSDKIQKGAVKFSRKFLRFERCVAVVCCAIPILLPLIDHKAPRETISAYYDMKDAQWFYFLLTVAAMLFLVNAVVREKHWFNYVLGLALAVVILFNCDKWYDTHTTAATVFFAGGALQYLFDWKKEDVTFYIIGAVIIAAALLGWKLLGLYALFVAESVALWVIAVDFLLHESREKRAQAEKRAHAG